jgi:hypothetical protein
MTFGVLAMAMGTGEFSLMSSLLDLLKQSIIGIVAGAVLGYVAALLIAHERWAFLAEYAPVVTLAAVVGAYFAADGLQASGFMAVFVFGIVLGNKDALGFKMEAGEVQKLEEYVATTAFITRFVHFYPARRPGRFRSHGSIPGGRHHCGYHLHVGRTAGDRFPVCTTGPACAVELQRDSVHVLDPRDRRHPGRIGRPVARYESARCSNDRVDHLHRHSHDDLNTSADNKMVGQKTRALRGKQNVSIELIRRPKPTNPSSTQPVRDMSNT